MSLSYIDTARRIQREQKRLGVEQKHLKTELSEIDKILRDREKLVSFLSTESRDIYRARVRKSNFTLK